MTLLNTLRQLLRPQQERPEFAPPDELLLRDAQQILRLLKGLSQSHRQVILQTKDARLMATGEMQVYGTQGLAIRIHADCRHAPDAFSDAALASMNVSAASEFGVLLFSLSGAKLQGHWLLGAKLPTELIRMQSRRHFRLCGQGKSGLLQQASISWPGLEGALALRDLSEEGAGLLLMRQAWPGPAHIKQARLQLGQEQLPIPLLQVVHERRLNAATAAADCSSVGTRLIGLQPQDLRSLRRWLLGTQAEMRAPLLDLVDLVD